MLFDSYVYFLTDDHGHVKIGKSNDMTQRLKELQTGNPYKLRILLTIGMNSETEAFMLEEELHRKFAKARLEGEWFKAEPVAEFLAQDVININHFTFCGRGSDFKLNPHEE